ncbi:hypothetical protein Tco_0715456 [Tanacetum coccineum]
MAENDKEKTRFHTEEGVYCFTHMPKELKNSAVTLQGIIEKLLSDQRRRNVEVYLKEIVVKSKMDEGSFLGHMVTKEGIRAYPEKVQTIIRSPTPKSPNQIRSLFIQLKAIIKFIPKLAELKYPIREKETTRQQWSRKGSTRKKLSMRQPHSICFGSRIFPKILNSKAEVLTGLATIKLEFLNQEVSVSIKTRPSVEETSSSKEEKSASNVPGAKPNYNWETSGSN